MNQGKIICRSEQVTGTEKQKLQQKSRHAAFGTSELYIYLFYCFL